MPTFDELQTKANDLIRKGLQGSIFVKPWASGDSAIETLQDSSGLLEIPTGYTDVGHITADQGANWTRDIETSDVQSLGSSEPTRRDITSDVTGLAFTMQESKKAVFELYEGVDLSAVNYDADGNLKYDKPDSAAPSYFRVLALFKDGEGADAIYFARWLPRCQVSDRGEQSWSEDNELQYPVTLTAFVDSDIGTSARTLWAASTEKLDAMGFSASGS